MTRQEKIEALSQLVASDIFLSAMKPLSTNAEVAINVEGDVFTLTKQEGKPFTRDRAPTDPNISFRISEKALASLIQQPSSDIGSFGITIVKLLVNPDPQFRASAQVHIGLFDLARFGYLSVLALGGAPFMKFLTSYGLTGMGKIRAAIAKLREKR